MAEIKQFTRDEIVETVNHIMVEEFEVDAPDLLPEAKLADLGLDSLDGVDMVVAIEKAFHCRLPEEESRTIATVGDIYDKVAARLEELKEAV